MKPTHANQIFSTRFESQKKELFFTQFSILDIMQNEYCFIIDKRSLYKKYELESKEGKVEGVLNQ